MENLYSINEAAKQLGGISPGTVKVWLSQGKLQRTKVGRRTMVAESELIRIREVGGISPARSPRRRATAAEMESAVD
jgi:excisionase family DNA binding protein